MSMITSEKFGTSRRSRPSAMMRLVIFLVRACRSREISQYRMVHKIGTAMETCIEHNVTGFIIIEVTLANLLNCARTPEIQYLSACSKSEMHLPHILLQWQKIRCAQESRIGKIPRANLVSSNFTSPLKNANQ
jgi:hypothetical protein